MPTAGAVGILVWTLDNRSPTKYLLIRNNVLRASSLVASWAALTSYSLYQSQLCLRLRLKVAVGQRRRSAPMDAAGRSDHHSGRAAKIINIAIAGTLSQTKPR